MIITAWRIVHVRLVADAFSGEGARLFGGRWNHKGHDMVYTASSVSLAALELLVHLETSQLLESYVQIPASFGSDLCRSLDLEHMPQDWANGPAPESTKSIGDEWLASGESPVLRVPSVLVPTESVYLINPHHPNFPKVRIGEPGSFEFDARLIGSRGETHEQ